MAENGNKWLRPGFLLKWGAGVLIVGGLMWVAFAPKPVPVDVAGVESGALEVTVSAEGRTRIRDIFTISAPVNGRVLRVTLDPGDPVEAGKTVVAIFEPVKPDFLDERTLAQARSRLEQAKAATIRAKAELDLARLELDRAKRLREGGHISQQGMDTAQSTFEARRAAYDAAAADQAGTRVATHRNALPTPRKHDTRA